MHFIISVLVSAVGIVVVLFLYIAHVLQKRARYFKKHGIPYLGLGLSRNLSFLRGAVDIVSLEEDVYQAAQKTGSPVVAMSDFFGQTNLLIADLDLLKHILVKDFDHFVNRRPVKTQQSSRFFTKMLFNTENEQWRGIRAKLSPTFTTGKLRRTFQIFKKSSDRMDVYLKEQMKYPQKKTMDLDFLEIFSKYSMDVIASCAFGIDSKSFDVPPSQRSTFERMGKQFGFNFGGKALFKFVLVMAAPKIADFFGIDVMDTEAQDYFNDVIKQVLKMRRETGERKEDFLQLMMDIQQGILKTDEEDIKSTNGDDHISSSVISSEGHHGKVQFDDDYIVANGMSFLLGGFDTTQTVLLFAAYSLALEPEIQEKVSQEISSVLGRHEGKLTYDAVSEMKYVDMVIDETLRKFPAATRTERACAKNYAVAGTNITIEQGALIVVPIHGVHQDARYFPDPKKFDPERFSSENKATRHPYAYMPFGNGPRNCIGMRFALITAKVVLVQLIYSFHFAPCSKTKIPVEFSQAPQVKPKDSMWLNVTVRNK